MRIVSLLVALCVILTVCGIPMANAQSNLSILCVRQVADNVVSIEVAAPTAEAGIPVTVMVTGPSGSPARNKLYQGFTDARGIYNPVPYVNKGDTGEYVITAILTKTGQTASITFDQISDDDKASILSVFNTQAVAASPNITAVETAVISTAAGLGLDLAAYNELEDKSLVYKNMLKNGKDTTPQNIDDIIGLFYQGVITTIAADKNSGAVVNSLLLTNPIYTRILALDDSLPPSLTHKDYLAELSPALKQAVYGAVFGKSYDTVEQLTNALCFAILNESLYGMDIWGNVPALLKRFSDFGSIELNWAGYNKSGVTETMKKSVCSAMMGKHFASFLNVQTSFNLLVDNIFSISGLGGNSGGGGRVPEITIPIPQITLPEPVQNDRGQGILFADMAEVMWANEAVSYLAGKGVINGYGDDTFRPNNVITRAELAVIVLKALSETAEASGAAVFTDISETDWYAGWAAKASKLVLILGDDQGRFNGNANVTREEAVVIIDRTLSRMGVQLPQTITGTFGDMADVSEWAQASAVKFRKSGIIKGRTEGTFEPSAYLTRAEAAKILYDAIKLAGRLQ